MSESKELQLIFQTIANQDIKPKDVVEKCAESSNDESKELLSFYIKSLEKCIKSISYDRLKKITGVVYRGLKFKSEQAEALKYFYFGYYAKSQENILKQANDYYQRIKIEEIASKKHFNSIMNYLAINGISRQKDISSFLHINKSNLSRLLDEVSEYKLINKVVGPKAVFYELTSSGYKYCKTHNLNSGLTLNKNIWLDNDRVLAYRRSQYNYIEEDDYGTVDVKLMLDDNASINKVKFQLKAPFIEEIDFVETSRYDSLPENVFEMEMNFEKI